MAGSKSKKGRAKSRGPFVPIFLAGPEGADREGIATVVARELDVEPESSPKISRTALSRTGVLFWVPGPSDDPVRDLSEGLALVRAADRSVPVVVVGDGWDGATVSEAWRVGVDDVLFFQGGLSESLRHRVSSWISRRSSASKDSLFGEVKGAPRFIGGSPAIMETIRMVGKIAPTDATALILGESGTGKELIARAIHALSPRKGGPFIAINCAAIPETLLENELFGHERGAYTGASSTAIGKVEAADKGTLFLDEIGEMPIQLQSKILRLIQEKTFDRIGGTASKTADIRIVAATNVDLKREIDEGRFREDLYYRLSVVPLVLPALRDRSEDIPLLVDDILERLSERLGRPGLSVAADAMRRIVAHRWPGNVRELENELERAAVLSASETLENSDFELSAKVIDPEWQILDAWLPEEATLAEAEECGRDRAARLSVAREMSRTAGDFDAAAKRLGIEPETLRRLLDSAAGSASD